MSSRKIRKTKNQGTQVIDRSVLILLGATVGVLVLVAAIMLINQQQNSSPSDYVPEVTGAPRVAVAEEVVDYGDVPLNTTIETVFRVQNVGDQPLHIQGEPQVELIEGC